MPHEVLGQGRNPWTNILKIETLQSALRRVTTPYVIACDSADVLILRDPGDCVDLFEQLRGDLLYIGRTAFCRDFFDQAAAQTARQVGIPRAPGTSGAGTSDDDQSIMKRLYLAQHPRVQVDFRCQIFQPLTYQDRDVLQLVKDGTGGTWRRALSSRLRPRRTPGMTRAPPRLSAGRAETDHHAGGIAEAGKERGQLLGRSGSLRRCDDAREPRQAVARRTLGVLPELGLEGPLEVVQAFQRGSAGSPALSVARSVSCRGSPVAGSALALLAHLVRVRR